MGPVRRSLPPRQEHIKLALEEMTCDVYSYGSGYITVIGISGDGNIILDSVMGDEFLSS
jgi:hypothetical protein